MSQLSFQYRAIGRDGAVAKGVMSARDKAEAYQQLVATGFKPLRIAPLRGARSKGKGKRIKAKDIAHFTQQFAVLMDARIPIVEGLRSIGEQEPNQRMARVVLDIADGIASGTTVTEAMSPHRSIFGDVYVETVRAAEASGNMPEILNKLASMLEQQNEMTKTVKGALMYPICVVGTLSLAVLFLMVFVIPRFADMFARRGVELPLATKALMGFSGMLQSYWYVLIGLAVAAFFGLKKARTTERGREVIDRLLHRIPVISEILRGMAISRFSHVFGISLRSGLSLIDALQMSGKASGRPMLVSDAEKMRQQVNQGGRLSDCLFACSYLPPFTRRMLAAGEESAELPRMCDTVAHHYDREVGHLAKNIATVIEPVMIVGLAVIVLIIALAIFLPMWNMAALVQ